MLIGAIAAALGVPAAPRAGAGGASRRAIRQDSDVPASAATMVPGYRHRPGEHCGSTALRNLLAFHGLELSEEMALGLGAGACFYYVTIEGGSPSRFTNGRVSALEQQFVEATELPLRLDRADDPGVSWTAARRAVDSGRPALLLTDLYYLDHYGRSAHFPGHAVVLAGYDDERAYLSDTGFAELQTTRLESLRRARHGKLPIFPLAGEMLTVPPQTSLPDPRPAAPRAIARAAERMLAPPLGELEGLPALRRFAAEVASWPAQAEDWRWCARFCYQVIERRGTGGGNFRRMYSRFLGEVAEGEIVEVAAEAELAAAAADAWADLAAALLAASEEEPRSARAWRRIGERADAVLALEERLWPALAARISA